METPNPTSSTIPDTSQPSTFGPSPRNPGMRRWTQSVGLSPVARTRTRTSDGPGVGSGCSTKWSTSGPPRMFWVSACMVWSVIVPTLVSSRLSDEWPVGHYVGGLGHASYCGSRIGRGASLRTGHRDATVRLRARRERGAPVRGDYLLTRRGSDPNCLRLHDHSGARRVCSFDRGHDRHPRGGTPREHHRVGAVARGSRCRCCAHPSHCAPCVHLSGFVCACCGRSA